MIKRAYNTFPKPMKEAILQVKSNYIPFPYNYGIQFSRDYCDLMRSQWYSEERLRGLQFLKLKALLRHAYRNVPYYRRMFKEQNLEPNDVKTFKDFAELPILTKDDIRRHANDLIARNWETYSPSINHTSGSTSEPLNYYEPYLKDMENKIKEDK